MSSSCRCLRRSHWSTCATVVCVAVLTSHLGTQGRPQVAKAAVVGTFNSTRAGSANLATGTLSAPARASLLSHFPGTTIAGTATLTPGFLAGVDMLVIASVKDIVAISPLSAAEQSAMVDFAMGGGTVLLLADGYIPYALAAQSMVSPFGLSIVDDGVIDLQPCTLVVPSHPVFDGPFGQVTSLTMYGAGNFIDMGPSAAIVAEMNSTGLPVMGVIEQGALGPGSGRVVIYADSSQFAGPNGSGLFSESETLFLNTIQYLIPEPSALALAVVGAVGLTAVGWRRKLRQA